MEGTVHAVNGISWTLEEGEVLAVVGESGSGKSVSMMSILGLIPRPPGEIVSGEALYLGRDLLQMSEEELEMIRGREIGMIFQDPMTSLNPTLSIQMQMTESLRRHLGMEPAAAEQRALELMEMVGIPDAANRITDYPHQFSGGMRQRVMIAMMLACNPSVLIADEPTTALDVTIQAQIVDLMHELREKLGMALIWITHDLGVVASIADRVSSTTWSWPIIRRLAISRARASFSPSASISATRVSGLSMGRLPFILAAIKGRMKARHK